MELIDFLCQTQLQVKNEVSERMASSDKIFPYDELVFADIVMQHMAENGMTYEPQVCHYSAKDGNANLRLSGYSISDDCEQLDLFVSLYDGVTDIVAVPDKDTKSAAEQCLRFLVKCAQGKLASKMDESNDAYELARVIQETYIDLEQIRIYVLTDRQAKTKKFKDQESNGKTIKLEVMDIERLYRHWSEGKPRDELVVNFEEVSGGALPCIYVPGEDKYDYALTAMPGEALRFMYEKYGARLLEANVRSFLSVTGKVNQGIRKTLQEQPEQFMAYNNGVVIVADDLHLGSTKEGGAGILWLKGMQIVNGGQTTASIYFSKKKDPKINLTKVRVPAKIIILKSRDIATEEALISDISKYANSQNVVKLSDLSANKPFHIEMERLSMTTYCPDGVGRWFYERASGSYNTFLAREGTTPSRLKQLKEVVTPSSRKIIKTDLAKYINAWGKKPHLVSLGSQKNFEQFMNEVKAKDTETTPYKPTLSEYKQMIAKAIIFKKTQSLARGMFSAYQANVTAYVVSILSDRVGNNIDLEKIWLNQDISQKLKEQIGIWASEVNSILESTSNGRMISEWAKKEDCWSVVSKHIYTPMIKGIPEVQY